MAKYLPRLLQNLIRDTNPTGEALYLNATKTRITWETLTIKIFDRETQKKTTETWTWKELGIKRLSGCRYSPRREPTRWRCRVKPELCACDAAGLKAEA